MNVTLTPTQVIVLKELVETDLSAKEIAWKRRKSIKTIDSQRLAIYKAYGVNSRHELCRRVLGRPRVELCPSRNNIEKKLNAILAKTQRLIELIQQKE